jgi:hypothetical protein
MNAPRGIRGLPGSREFGDDSTRESRIMKPRNCLIAAVVFHLHMAGCASAATYFVSPAGRDANKGTSVSSPWASLSKVNRTHFQPGDFIRFKAGARWAGELWPKGSGTAGEPITLGSYGSGAKPVIDAQGVDGTAAIKLENQEYWTIENMEVANWAAHYGTRWGIYIGASDGRIKHGLKVLNNTVRDVCASPIRSPAADAGYPTFYKVGGIFIDIPAPGRADGVLIEGNYVTRIIGEGIAFFGQWESKGVMNYSNCSPHVVVRNNTVNRTAGDGILILGTDDELVEHNLVEYAGTMGVPGTDLIAGMWPTRHVNGLWQFNVVHHTARWKGDGEGLDNDCFVKGVTIFQDNYSHDNAGGFFLDCFVPDGGQSIVRYNISENDGMLGDLCRDNALYYNNVFYAPGRIVSAKIEGSAKRGNMFYNNIFWCAGMKGFENQAFSHNAYYGGTAPMGGDGRAINSDPQFVNAAGAKGVEGFQLLANSPCLGKGSVIENNGGLDLWGNPVSTTQPPNVGAYGGPGVGVGK